MRAVVFDRCGSPADVLTVRDLPVPTPGRGEVLVRMLASPINPSDLMYIQGQYGLTPRFPATPGFEGVGIVEKTGGGLLGWLRKGKRVAVINDRIGNWAEYTVTAARKVIPVPDAISDEAAASFFVNPVTAVALIDHVLQVPRGEWLLQSAAGSALGKMIVRLAQRRGIRCINIVRRREQVAELSALGAEFTLVESEGSIPDRVKEITGGNGVKYAIDPVGGQSGSDTIASLAHGGRAISFGTLSGQPLTVEPRFLIAGARSIEGFWLGEWAKNQSIPRMLRTFREVRELYRDGIVATDVAGTYALEDVAKAVEHAAKPAKNGKVILRIGTR